jgi:hypothetical protein
MFGLHVCSRIVVHNDLLVAILASDNMITWRIKLYFIAQHLNLASRVFTGTKQIIYPNWPSRQSTETDYVKRVINSVILNKIILLMKFWQKNLQIAAILFLSKIKKWCLNSLVHVTKSLCTNFRSMASLIFDERGKSVLVKLHGLSVQHN